MNTTVNAIAQEMCNIKNSYENICALMGEVTSLDTEEMEAAESSYIRLIRKLSENLGDVIIGVN